MDKETLQEFIVIRSEFSQYRVIVDKRFEDLFDKLKPQFTSKEITALLFTFLMMMAGAIAYVSSLKSNQDNIQKEVERQARQTEKDKQLFILKMDKTYEKVVEVSQDVAILKDNKVEASDRKKQIEKNKQIVRDWATNN